MVLYLLSCLGNEDLYEQRWYQLVDADADGFSIQQGDCNDQDASIHPAAEEICDQIDNDCDGEIDEGQRNACDECGELPPDICDGLDNDCDESVDEDLIRECETLCGTGFETCLDSRWLGCTAPQPAEEECDGLDNDCDGQLDEGIECECTIDQVGALFPLSLIHI